MTDTVVRLLPVITDWRERGLLELWVEFGSGEHRRHLPLHILAARLGPSLCSVLVEVHVLTGDDALSKIGTKHAAFACEPEKYLTYFAESHDFNDELAEKVEEYLVRVWASAGRKTPSKTFDQLRLEHHIKVATPKPLAQLPPTSNVIRAHIQWAFYVVYNVLNLLDDRRPVLDHTNHGWICDDGTPLPVKGLMPLPAAVLTVCRCDGKCATKSCQCAKAGLVCVVFCLKSKVSECQNRYWDLHVWHTNKEVIDKTHDHRSLSSHFTQFI